MLVDLLLDIDDDLLASVQAKARSLGEPAEELIRRALCSAAGLPYQPASGDSDMLMRPMVRLDIRT